MRVETRTRRRRTRLYESALVFGYINLMLGVIVALMGVPTGAVPMVIGLTTWSMAAKYARRYGLE